MKNNNEASLGLVQMVDSKLFKQQEAHAQKEVTVYHMKYIINYL